VAVDDFDVLSITASPLEADAVLIVDPDRMLASPILLQRLEVIARESAQIVERFRFVQHHVLAARDQDDACRKAFARLPSLENGLGSPIFEALDHAHTRAIHCVSRRDTNVQPSFILYQRAPSPDDKRAAAS
jgi:hypothetical protein